MEALDAASMQSFGLPSMAALNADRAMREELERKPLAPAMMAASFHPFSAPPQSSPANASGPLAGLLSPPESRRMSGDDKEQPRLPALQSLPSIHEALGRSESSLAFSAPVPPPPSAPASAAQSYIPSPPPASSTLHRGTAFAADPASNQSLGHPFPHPRSPYINPSAAAPPPPRPQAPPDSLLRPSFSESRPSLNAPPHNPTLPTLHPLRTTQSPPPGSGRPSVTSATFPPQHPAPATSDTSGPHSSGPMNPSYDYAQYRPSYPLSAPTAGAHSTFYPASASTYSTPSRGYAPASSWPERSLEVKKILSRSSLALYGESVKRHLESFDLEVSLNEMAEGAGRITDFSKDYRQRAHRNQRIGMTPQSTPRLDEVEEMIKHGERIQMSLQRMRDVVFNHQASMTEPPQDPRYRPTNGFDHEAPSMYCDDAKGGNTLSGSDGKKPRRGPSQRAAPPGRCHSCNRAETPEWRRGPDGARTLCNACGLHYAKLTRKMGGKQAMTSSTLRPKSVEQGPPTA